MKDLKNTLDQVIKAGAQDITASRGNVTRHTLVDLQRWADALPVYAADVAGEEETDAHTPGPYKLQLLEEYRHGYDWKTYCIRSAKTNVCLAVVGAVDRYESERITKTALLMSKAPELLEVCQAIAELNQGQGQLNLCMVANWAEQVIKSAT